MGRPRKTSSSLNFYRLAVAVSPEELELLERRAELAQMTLSGYLRLVALGKPLPPFVPARNREASIELSRQVGNLSQLKHAQRYREGYVWLPENEYNEVRRAAKEAEATLLGLRLSR